MEGQRDGAVTVSFPKFPWRGILWYSRSIIADIDNFLQDDEIGLVGLGGSEGAPRICATCIMKLRMVLQAIVSMSERGARGSLETLSNRLHSSSIKPTYYCRL